MGAMVEVAKLALGKPPVSLAGMVACRRAIEQRPLPFNLSVVSDFMRHRDRYWKDRVLPGTATFSQIARKLESEVCRIAAVCDALL